MIRYNPIVYLVYGTVVNLPTPTNISYMWNFRSLIGLFLVSQILSRFFLSIHFSTSSEESFNSVAHIILDVNYR